MRSTDAPATIRFTSDAIGAYIRFPLAIRACSASRLALTLARTSSRVTRRDRSIKYTPRSGDTVSPSRSAAIRTFVPSGLGVHEYSGAMVRTVLLWKRRVRVIAGRS